MIAVLFDEDFNARIIRGLRRRVPDLDLITAGNAGLAGQVDSQVAAWAAESGRVIITHDVNTMTLAAAERIREGKRMPGIIAVPQSLGIGPAISDLEIIANCAEPEDFDRRIIHLPL